METPETAMNDAVDHFLSTGDPGDSDPAALALACENRIRLESQRSLKSAMEMAIQFCRFAQQHKIPFLLSAQRSLARVAHISAKFPEAEQAYLAARLLAGKDAMLRARIDRALIDIYMYLGNLDESRRRGRSALTYFRRQSLPAEVAMTKVNLANMLHRQDRHREAEQLYAQAAEYFAGTADELSLARCYYNRANTLVQLFEIEEAESLYRQSLDLYTKHDHQLDALDARYGLAWLQMLIGKMHIALTELSECEKGYRAISQPKGAALCVLDLAEVYLSLNLFSDALDAAQKAEHEFRSLRLHYESAKAAFFVAKASAHLGKTSITTRALQAAEQGFSRDRNYGFLGALSLVKAGLCRTATARKKELSRARKLFSRAQLTMWEAVCDLNYAGEREFAAPALQRAQRNPAVQRIPHLFAWWHTMSGDLASRQGHQSKAQQHWKTAAERLDAVRAQLPPVELRTRFGPQGFDPHVRLIDALVESKPREAAAWSERYKTAGVWAPVSGQPGFDEVRGRVGQSLADLAQRVAALSQRLGGVNSERAALGAAAHKGITALQRQVRLEMASAEEDAVGELDPVERLIEDIDSASRRLPIVQFHFSQDDLIAFVHDAGATRWHRYANGRSLVQKMMLQWRFLMETELLAQTLPSSPALSAEENFFSRAADLLWRPLELLASVPQILLLPEGDLANFPWQALRVESNPLLERHHIVISPSLRHCESARKRQTNSRTVMVFQGDSSGLPGTNSEVARLQNIAGEQAITFSPARRADWPTSGEARLWHYTGHAHLRQDNPFYSYLALADGPLFAADMRLRQVTVELATLAACRSGEQISVPGEESTGLVRGLLEMGARNVLASYWPVSDQSTTLWMTSFYDAYFAGKTVAEAYRTASQTVRATYPSAYHWAAWGVHGADQ